jgi:hypothetical protein
MKALCPECNREVDFKGKWPVDENSAAAASRQLNESPPVFQRVWWMGSGHLENSFSLFPNTLYETGSTSPSLSPRTAVVWRPSTCRA